MLSYGADMNGKDNPFELGFERLIDLEQDADFMGKQALKEIKANGITRKLCGIEIQGEPLDGNEDWWRIHENGAQVGTARSVVYSPRLKKNIALAMLDIGYTEPGTSLEVTTPWGERAVSVVPLPFYDPNKTLAKS